MPSCPHAINNIGQGLWAFGDPVNGWYVETYGPDGMIGFGAVYITDSEADEDLELVARGVT